MKIEKFSLGIGDRFARQGRAQLQAVLDARQRGIELTPVWNKSNREHTIVRSEPISVRHEADEAVVALDWKNPYRVDADHINLGNVDRFIESSDFYTIDVADYTGRAADSSEIEKFAADCSSRFHSLSIPGMARALTIDRQVLEKTAARFLGAMQEAGRIYRHIAQQRGDDFIAEVSVDETEEPQTPIELFLILAMLAREKVRCQTIAPKFTGRFNKGVDYVGDLRKFETEFEENLCIVRYAITEFDLPETLKLSVHSGSDKFSLYSIVNRLLKKHGAGLHVKTAGTTWLEEMIGLAEADGAGLEIAKDIYVAAYERFDELVKPYASVVDIDPGRLPAPEVVRSWSSGRYQAALRHDLTQSEYNRDLRQLLHVSFKIAAEMGPRFLDALAVNEVIVSRNVTDNLLNRHILPLFG